jgi:hypothetical protein
VTTLILFPDYASEGRRKQQAFVTLLRRTCPDAVIFPILNGAPAPKLKAAAGKLTDCQPIIAAGARGLLDTLLIGYQTVLRDYNGGQACVVRLDPSEHQPSAIPSLIEAAKRARGMAIGDLRFGSATLRPGSIDEFAQLDLFPALYRFATGGVLPLSGAHGFQVFAPDVLAQVLTSAQKIVALAGRRSQQPVLWGFDGAMALGAVGAGVPVVIRPVEAQVLRDRSRQKVAVQFEQAMQLCAAAGELFDFTARTKPGSRA